MAVGDWNVTPDEFMQSTCAKKLKVTPVCPNIDATCASGRGRMLDYVICPPMFRPFLGGAMAVTKVPWRPRVGLHIRIARKPAKFQILSPVRAEQRKVPHIT
eukprot:9190519-Pyramimonas_sp.AAC.1